MKSKLYSEKESLDSISDNYIPIDLSAQDRIMRELCVKTFKPYIKKGYALELGCSDGYMTELLSRLVARMDVVDGSKKFISKAKLRNLSNVRFIHSLFEEYKKESLYDYVFATYIMEHINDPQQVLKIISDLIKPEGLLFVVVPNARALSRQLALHMGLIDSLYDLTENDLRHGHRRVYDRIRLNQELTRAGFSIVSQGGILLKLLADFQMEKLIQTGILQEPQINGLYSIGFEYPDLCGSIFSICSAAQ